MDLELTKEQVKQSVSAAYDSVALLAELNAKETLTEEEVVTLVRNEEHVRIMMGKVWFVAGLTDLQVTELQAI
tara:strand:- start:4842 stop:5060 length:219 start_codon:yes stop_codon:yes gene_type:complete